MFRISGVRRGRARALAVCTLIAVAVTLGGSGVAVAQQAASVDPQVLLDRIDALEKRLKELEDSAVLSEPETRVKKIEVYVDKNGNEFDQPVEGAKKTVTYQRERVYRRQTISEKIDEALADSESKSVKLGIDAAMVTQQVNQTQGAGGAADGHAYALASADLFFSAHIAQNTSLFADVVGLSGSPPDSEVGGLTLLNGYAARLVRQNEVNLREAWIRTELFDQKLALVAGRLDLTAFFDRNAAANDETSQFVSDALVNNPMLGLSSNGAGLAAVYDPRGSLNLKLGVQQSNPDALNLSESMYTLAEVGYRARPSFLGEGNYRVWYRTDNSSSPSRTAFGVSLDQKLNPIVTAFGRYGSGEADFGHDRFYSVGLQFQTGWVLNPLDVWGLGYAKLNLAADEREQLFELYYNMHLSDKFRLSFHLQHATDTDAAGAKQAYLVPGVRLQAGL
ncbi:MAG: carbohydrate porin [Pseudomonadota bacterium]